VFFAKLSSLRVQLLDVVRKAEHAPFSTAWEVGYTKHLGRRADQLAEQALA
jgi:hypothetical protein